MANPSESVKCSPYPEIRGLQVRVDGGRIILTGSVTTYYMKQMAQETIRRDKSCIGYVVVNEVAVKDKIPNNP